MDNLRFKAIRVIGKIDEQHRLWAEVPLELPPGQVQLIVLLSGDDETGGAWAHGLCHEWSTELSDLREDIYTLEDGQPLNAAG